MIHRIPIVLTIFLTMAFEIETARAADVETTTAPSPATSGAAVGSSTSNESVLRDLDYPELQVVPRASERVQMEAMSEDENRFFPNWTFFASGFATLVGGLQARGHYRDDLVNPTDQTNADNSALLATGVGAAWIGVATYLSFAEPMKRTSMALRRMKASDKRSELYRERIAEESLEKHANLVWILSYASVLTNLAASANAGRNVDASTSRYTNFAALCSILPILFRPSPIVAFEKHQEYKRRIYSPLAWMDWNQERREWTQHLAVRWEF